MNESPQKLPPVNSPAAALREAIERKSQLLDAFDRSQDIHIRITALVRLTCLIRATRDDYPKEACCWGVDALRRVCLVFSDKDELRFAKPRFTALLLEVCHQLAELISDPLERLRAA